MTSLQLFGAPPPNNLMMVTYDLRQIGQNYPALAKALQALGALRVQQSTWWVVTPVTDVALRNYLLTFIDGNDSLVVGQLSSLAGHEGNPVIRTWIEAYLRDYKAA
jgi:CRISPR-associated endonuclease Cas2